MFNPFENPLENKVLGTSEKPNSAEVLIKYATRKVYQECYNRLILKNKIDYCLLSLFTSVLILIVTLGFNTNTCFSKPYFRGFPLPLL